jgi:uncharacterized 2Fe-2S/4Fe-4S cluster protein (DUF4445 family)
MQAERIRITFQPSGRTVHVLPGSNLLEAAGRAGIVLQTPCGGKGTCGKCRVRVTPPDACRGKAGDTLSPGQLAAGHRLACQSRVVADAIVEIPRESLFESRHQILESDSGRTTTVSPVIRKRYFELTEPTIEDPRSDLARLRDAVEGTSLLYELLHSLPGFLRGNGWRGTAVIAGDQTIALERGDTSKEVYGVAFDLGTTTIVGTLFDLVTGQQKGVASAMNPQVAFGDDVIARISRVRDNPGNLAEMRHSACGAMNSIVADLSQHAHIAPRQIYEVTVAGNSTMQQILCGLDPAALGEVPFVPVHDCPLTIPTQSLGLSTNPAGQLYVFPQIGGFVGGDTVAGILATRLLDNGESSLLVDIGTNGEIVLVHEGQAYAASTAAGPAFEGARITQGMRATAGAIDKVVIRDDVALATIDDTSPVGICGTALIDVAAELLRLGIVDETGRVLSAKEAPNTLPAVVRDRLLTTEGETRFVLVRSEHAGGDDDICLWQRDIRELQLATGAIRAGINILLRRMGISADDLDRVLLAGAFGNFIRRSNARRIGLLPQIDCTKIRFIGNAASLGAKLALLSSEERTDTARIAETVEHIDLSLDLAFQMEFAEAMMFPLESPTDACAELRV